MATDPKYVSANAGVGLTDLLGLLGGQQTTQTRSSDTGALQGVMGQLQAQDPMALLQTIFTQASGQMPGLQARMANAVGARSGGNSAVSTALQRLLQQTTLLGQQQVAAQQAQNLATQGQVAGKIAEGNSRINTQTGTNLGRAGRNLGLLSAGSKILNSDMVKTGIGKGKNFLEDLFSSGESQSADGLTSSAADFMGPMQDLTSVAPDLGSADFSSFDFSADPGMFDGLGDVFSGVGESAGDAAGAIDWDVDFGYKDGGMVGRDSPSETRKYKDGGIVMVEENGRMVPKVGSRSARKDSGSGPMSKEELLKQAGKKDEKPANPDEGKNIFRATNDRREREAGIGFADGGEVTQRAGGGRRSAAPTYTPDSILQSVANQGGMLGVTRSAPAPGGGLQRGNNSAGGESPEGVAAQPGTSVGRVAANFAMLGLNPLGFVASIMDQAAKQQNPAQPAAFSPALNTINALTMQNPLAAIQALMQVAPKEGTSGLDGGFSAGAGAMSSSASAQSGLSPAVSAALGLAPASTAPMSTSQAHLDSVSPAATAIDASLDSSQSSESADVDAGYDASFDGDGGGAGYGGYGGGGFGGAGAGASGGWGGAGDGGGGGADGGGGFGGGYGGFAKDGGEMQGPGTGTSDSINVNVSDGEYIVPADVVARMGVQFFDNLREHFHDFSERPQSIQPKTAAGKRK